MKNNEIALPEEFLSGMKNLLREEYDSFLASYSEGRKNALRLNRLKITPREFEASAPFPAERVPWTENGYYVDWRDMPGQHPWYRAGVYYLQEPSAMAPARILPAAPGDRVLDLCAAPGGKATELGARLGGRGILIANEISSSRVRALERNIELFGIKNCVVTNETPQRLSRRFADYFDHILVDAPCSGEGMFRKDPEAVKAWYPEKSAECARVQRSIILEAASMLRPGGYMVYSTCTFEPMENELVIAYLLGRRPDMELIRIPCTGGFSSFSRAYSVQDLTGRGYDVSSMTGIDNGASIDNTAFIDTMGAVRIWPHRAGGEGHFIALLHRKMSEGESVSGMSSAGTMSDPVMRFEERTRDSENDSIRTSGTRTSEARNSGTMDSGTRYSGAVNRNGKNSGRKRGGAAGPAENLQEALRFLKKYTPVIDIDADRCEVRDGRVYLMPEGCPDIRGLRFLRAGLYLGDLKKNRFEPSHELALAMPAADDGITGAVINDDGITDDEITDGGVTDDGITDGGVTDNGITDDGIRVRMRCGDERLGAFLRGEAIRLNNGKEKGWRLVCADKWPAGWGKLSGGVLKNHIPPSWRC